MGYMLETALCSECGYSAGEFALGMGILNDVPTVIVACPTCRAFRQVTSDDDVLHCPECGTVVEPLRVLQSDPDATLPCPRCGVGTVKFTLMGIWD